MAFRSVADNVTLEREPRSYLKGKLLSFGNSFLDDSLLGIRPDDLVLVGAPSGVGKTQFCVNVALANTESGKRVHFFALEAGQYEIERRLKFQIIAREFYGNPDRKSLGRPLRFDEWECGEFDGMLDAYESMAESYCANMFKSLFTFYKGEQFDSAKLIEHVTFIQEETDLIIVDHIHYFDWDDQNDNRAMKEIAKTARDLCLRAEKPMILVAHLRKRDRANQELCAGLDEFHGSSDLAKIATKVITLASGGAAEDGGFYTYLRTPKNRHSSSSARFLARMIFNENRGGYEKAYKVGWANSVKFGEVEPSKLPSWIGRSITRGQVKDSSGGDNAANFARSSRAAQDARGNRNYAPGSDND